AWQTVLWRFVPIGSYRDDQTVRQQPNDPVLMETQTVKVAIKPAPGQEDVTLYLKAHESPSSENDLVIWQRPRFEAVGKPPLLLRDYAEYGPQYVIDYSRLFADTDKYLSAAARAAQDRKLTVEDLAKWYSIDPSLLQRWIDLLALTPAAK